MDVVKEMREAFERGDPQRAADIIASAVDSVDRQKCMDAAVEVGFLPTFYGGGIRVHFYPKRGQLETGKR